MLTLFRYLIHLLLGLLIGLFILPLGIWLFNLYRETAEIYFNTLLGIGICCYIIDGYSASRKVKEQKDKIRTIAIGCLRGFFYFGGLSLALLYWGNNISTNFRHMDLECKGPYIVVNGDFYNKWGIPIHRPSHGDDEYYDDYDFSTR